jgi:hypothetical protein
VGASVFYESASELATLANTFSVAGTPTDPATVGLTITAPSGTATTYTYAAAQITKTSTGVYTKDIACSEADEWQYEWVGTGTAADVEVGTWTVFESTLGRLYATVSAVKSRLGITDTVDDYELHGACFAASRWLETYCDRHFWRTPAATVRTFVPTGQYCLDLPEFNDLVSVASLKTDGSGDGTFETTWDAADYQLLPHNPSAAPERKPYTRIKAVGARTFPAYYSSRQSRDDRVEITGVFGWPAVPWAIRQSALIIAAETFKLKDTFAGQGGYGEFGPVVVRRNPQALDFAKPYRRNAVLVA